MKSGCFSSRPGNSKDNIFHINTSSREEKRPALIPYAIPFLFLADTFSLNYFDSAIRGTTFLPTFCHFADQISYPFDFVSWHNLLVEFYGNGRPVDIIFRQAQSQSSRFLICVILRQTYFLQVPLVRNITSHTLN